MSSENGRSLSARRLAAVLPPLRAGESSRYLIEEAFN
jgi:hypothetical protein